MTRGLVLYGKTMLIAFKECKLFKHTKFTRRSSKTSVASVLVMLEKTLKIYIVIYVRTNIYLDYQFNGAANVVSLALTIVMMSCDM